MRDNLLVTQFKLLISKILRKRKISYRNIVPKTVFFLATCAPQNVPSSELCILSTLVCFAHVNYTDWNDVYVYKWTGMEICRMPNEGRSRALLLIRSILSNVRRTCFFLAMSSGVKSFTIKIETYWFTKASKANRVRLTAPNVLKINERNWMREKKTDAFHCVPCVSFLQIYF